ncbi:hypothetical protein ACT8ZV_20160 [Nocardioides sp. MAHUQ-72]|uniref:hypothetical protein n=1 Tax=unclassified Nocardioides TaxID=2615069 RepID=UPI003613D5BD
MRTMILAAAGLLLAACGETQVGVDSPVADPYDGPLTVAPRPDSPDPAKRGGSAALALECEGDVYAAGGGDYADSGLETVQDDPRAAFSDFADQEGGAYPGPVDDFVVERVEDGRVLLSYDVDGETKVALVVADGVRDWKDDTGWGVEAWAQCDPAELPAGVAEAHGDEVWEDAQGNRVPVTTVTSHRGPEHCDWQDIVFLSMGSERYPADHLFLRDEEGLLQDLLRTTFSDSVALPRDATDTGYQHDGRRLWLAADGSAAYLVSTSDRTDVERWPAASSLIGCD